MLVGICCHQGKLDAREEDLFLEVLGRGTKIGSEKVKRDAVGLLSFAFACARVDRLTYDDSEWPQLIREMPNHILNGLLGLAAPFLFADSPEDFEERDAELRNAVESIRRRAEHADSADS